MSEPTAIAAACAITCASRELSRILRHDAPREDDNSVIVHEVVDRFHYGPVMAALAVKTSGTSRFRAYLRYKGETQGQWRKSFDLGQDARDIVELKLMAMGGWSDIIASHPPSLLIRSQKGQSLPTRQNQVTELSVVSWSPKTYRDPRLVQGSSGERKPACAKEYDPPDGEFLVRATGGQHLKDWPLSSKPPTGEGTAPCRHGSCSE